MILKRNFFSRPTLDVAKDMLGCYLVRKFTSGRRQKIIRAMITDVEAYIGEDDLACHASKGRTPRSEILYGESGHAYVYLIYGMYYIVNFVTEKKDFPAAVMIRGLANMSEWKANKSEWVSIKNVKLDGPGKVCRELKIDKSLHGIDITHGEKLWIEKGKKIDSKNIQAAERVGIAYAQHCALYPWRFYIEPVEEK